MNSLLILSEYNNLAYFVLFLLMFIEGGDATLLASGFLIRLGYLDFWLVFPISIAGIFIRDIILYKIGRKYVEGIIEQCGRFLFITPKRFSAISQRLKNSRGKTIFISKFLYGLNHITILAVGAAKIDFKRFLKLDIITIIFWEIIMLGLGFFLGHSFSLVRHYVKDISIFLAITLVSFILIELFIKKLIKFNGNSQ